MKSTFQILCGVSTVRGLDIMKNGCPELPGSVCEKCGMGDFDHSTNACKNEAKCVNCHKNHQSKSNQCEIWKKEKEIMKIKVTQKITYLKPKRFRKST